MADTNPWWENKTAVKDDYTEGGVTPVYAHTDWSPIYDELAGGIIAGESQVTGNQWGRFGGWRPLMTIHPTNQWFTGGPIAIASAFLGNRDWLTFDSCQ